MKIEIVPGKIFKIHVAIIFLLLCANALSIVKLLYFHDAITMFDFDEEKNIPSYFSSLMIFVSSALLYLIASNNKKAGSPYIAWFGLSLIFLFLSVDEAVSIHERFNVPLREAYGMSGILHYAWIVPYGLALFIFILLYVKFLLSLPKSIMTLFLLSGFIFVSGAVGFELLGGNQAQEFGRNNLLYRIYCSCEEFLEMFGIAIFIYTLLTYIDTRWGSFTISDDQDKIASRPNNH